MKLAAMRKTVPERDGGRAREKDGGRACCLGWASPMRKSGTRKGSKTGITGAGRSENVHDQRKTMQHTLSAAHTDEGDPEAPTRDQDHPNTANVATATDAHIALEAGNPESEDRTAVAKDAQPLRSPLAETSEQQNHYRARTRDPRNQPT